MLHVPAETTPVLAGRAASRPRTVGCLRTPCRNITTKTSTLPAISNPKELGNKISTKAHTLRNSSTATAAFPLLAGHRFKPVCWPTPYTHKHLANEPYQQRMQQAINNHTATHAHKHPRTTVTCCASAKGNLPSPRPQQARPYPRGRHRRPQLAQQPARLPPHASLSLVQLRQPHQRDILQLHVLVLGVCWELKHCGDIPAQGNSRDADSPSNTV